MSFLDTSNSISPMKQYTPFTKRYTMYKILNYGKPYTNYTTYKPLENIEHIETIYVDNKPCIDDKNLQILTNNLPYYIEIHYTKQSGKSYLETIMLEQDIAHLIAKNGNKL